MFEPQSSGLHVPDLLEERHADFVLSNHPKIPPTACFIAGDEHVLCPCHCPSCRETLDRTPALEATAAVMAKPPAVVMIARHGMRLDAADQSWHLSTPTPYDPPLTYGGWNQCRALGVRIASLLHAREQELNNAPLDVNGEDGAKRTASLKRKRRKHKIVIHSSPFQRCVQTSVAISAGIAQYQPPKESNARPHSAGRPRVAPLHSVSPRLRGLDGTGHLHSLTPIHEPRYKPLSDKRYRKSKLRVDAFLGEWLNPSYFEHITPPPPSPMMVAGAKAELLQNDAVDTYTPSMPMRSNGGSLWSPTPNVARPPSRESPLDDWSPVSETLPAPVPRRDRGSSVSSIGSNESSSGRKSPFRPGHVLQPFHSTMPREKSTFYVPPTPTYAVSSSDNIPRGYVAHARNACTEVDIQWDSSRPPQDWGDGGVYGEEWSEMHRRFRRGLNDLVEWYSQHSIDDRGDDVVGPDTIRVDDDVEEDLVVILVTHGAGSNALIGALTGQPVLLDVGMGSLTMAVRKDDVPLLPSSIPDRGSPDQLVYDDRRRHSIDLGLNLAYEMKLVASSEHLRPGSDPTRTGSIFNSRRPVETVVKSQTPFNADSNGSTTASAEANGDSSEPGRGTTSTALGTIRRPSAPTNVVLQDPHPGRLKKSNTTPFGFGSAPTTPLNFSNGLWTPPAARSTPPSTTDKPEQHEDKLDVKANGILDGTSIEADRMQAGAFHSNVASETAGSYIDAKPIANHYGANGGGNSIVISSIGGADENHSEALTPDEPDDVGALPADVVGDKLPSSLSRGLSQRGLWGSHQPTADAGRVPRQFGEAPKRRWTMVQEQ